MNNQVDSPFRDPRKNVEINVGKACNNKCVFCLDGMPSKEDQSFIDYADMKRELERFAASGHRSVGFLGGEPTMYPCIAESIAYAKELGYKLVKPVAQDRKRTQRRDRNQQTSDRRDKRLVDSLGQLPGTGTALG